MSSSTPEEPRENSAMVDDMLGEDQEADSSTNRSEFDPMNWTWGDIPNWNWYIPGAPDGLTPHTVDVANEILKPLLERDTKQCDAWKDEVQNILIFAGLFSAVVTAFIIESYQKLQSDPNDQIISLLSRIADQMNTPTGNMSSHTSSTPTSSGFIPSSSNIRVNIFWFISLVLSLTAALVGIIALQWLREHQLYDSGMQSSKVLAIFNARSDGLKRWYVPQIFTGLPLLLQAALVLFFAGLVEFLFAIRIEVAIPVAVAVAIPIFFLVVTTILPTLQLYAIHFPYMLSVNHNAPVPCPYKSPQSLLFQRGAVISSTLFNTLAWVFSVLWFPFVVISRVFGRSDKPFYGKSAPFNTKDYYYQFFSDCLRSAAGNWVSMDTQWLAARTSYALAIHTPNTCRDLRWPYIGDLKSTNALGFFDWVAALKNIARLSDPTNLKYRGYMYSTLLRILARISESWTSALEETSRDPEVGKALQAHITALVCVIGPYGHQQAQQLVQLSRGDIDNVNRGLITIMMDQASGYEFGFDHEYIHIRLSMHLRTTSVYLADNAHELFLCSNLPGITPSLSLSIRRSLSYHRDILVRKNPTWMAYMSHRSTQILEHVIMDTQWTVPLLPFTRKCTGSSTSRCGSNLHTESIIELTEYMILFQVADDIRATSRLLHDLCILEPNPVQARPFVLIIACAYINAAANVNQDNIDEFRMLLDTICALCGSPSATLDARPSGTGRHWPSMESAFDYIRDNVNQAASAAQVPHLPHNAEAAENV